MNQQDEKPQRKPSPNAKAEKPGNLKQAAIDLFKKSQRLPPLSRITKKIGQTQALTAATFEFADFYHL